MTMRFLPSLYILVGVLLLANCVREIDFQDDKSPISEVVVFAFFSDGPGPHIVKINYPSTYNKQVYTPVRGAKIFLQDDAGQRFAYSEVMPANATPYYELRGVRGLRGHSYSLEIQLPDGTLYRSRPEKIPSQAIPIDSVAIYSDWFDYVSAEGAVVHEPNVFVTAQAIAPSAPDDRYIRWEGECTYIFNENKPIDNHQCFVNVRLADQVIAVADPSAYQAGATMTAIAGRRKVNYVFEYRACFSVYQRTINRAAYQYWENASQITNPTGSIFDPPPAQLIGNFENISHPELPVLGYFEVAAVDTMRRFVEQSDLRSDFWAYVSDYCSTDLTPTSYCYDCLGWPGSTYEKPVWWQ